MEVNVFPSRPSMNMSLSTLHQMFQFNISSYPYLILFCFVPYLWTFIVIMCLQEEVQVFDYWSVNSLVA